jgi:hypothetical protein
MWVIEESARVTMRTKEKEAGRARLVSEARRQAQQDGTHRAWQWRVESGMDGAFRNLLGWRTASATRPGTAIDGPGTGGLRRRRRTRAGGAGGGP